MDISQAYAPQKQVRARLGIPSRPPPACRFCLALFPMRWFWARRPHKGLKHRRSADDDGAELRRRVGIRGHPAWTSPPHVLLIVAITFLVNSRHLLMGAALAPFIRHLPKRKAFASLFLMCDESWALGLADAKRRQSKGVNPALSLTFYAGVAIPFYLAWVVFTTLGAAFGPMMGDLRPYGFDMAFPAVFLVLLAGMWKGFAAARPWLVSLVVAALTYLTIPGAWYVAAGALSGLVAAYLLAGEE